jgi:mannose-6-phosphate isomerase-like protein (cupin superfamily)
VKAFAASKFLADRPWGSELLADFGEVTVRLHSSDEPYRWHANTGDEVFVVLDGAVDMHVRSKGSERVHRLGVGEGMSFGPGDEHVAQPVGMARMLVVERKDSE